MAKTLTGQHVPHRFGLHVTHPLLVVVGNGRFGRHVQKFLLDVRALRETGEDNLLQGPEVALPADDGPERL